MSSQKVCKPCPDTHFLFLFFEKIKIWLEIYVVYSNRGMSNHDIKYQIQWSLFFLRVKFMSTIYDKVGNYMEILISLKTCNVLKDI